MRVVGQTLALRHDGLGVLGFISIRQFRTRPNRVHSYISYFTDDLKTHCQNLDDQPAPQNCDCGLGREIVQLVSI